jgi:hypothetical protein
MVKEGGVMKKKGERECDGWALVGKAPPSLLAVFYYPHCRDVEVFFLSF